MAEGLRTRVRFPPSPPVFALPCIARQSFAWQASRSCKDRLPGVAQRAKPGHHLFVMVANYSFDTSRSEDMKTIFTYVYLLKSKTNPDLPYVGQTTDLNRRLAQHNAGKNVSTRRHRPWQIRVAIAFYERDKAVAFEKYLKSHSGRAFASKHF